MIIQSSQAPSLQGGRLVNKVCVKKVKAFITKLLKSNIKILLILVEFVFLLCTFLVLLLMIRLEIMSEKGAGMSPRQTHRGRVGPPAAHGDENEGGFKKPENPSL